MQIHPSFSYWAGVSTKIQALCDNCTNLRRWRRTLIYWARKKCRFRPIAGAGKKPQTLTVITIWIAVATGKKMSAIKHSRPYTNQDDLLEMVWLVRKLGGMSPKWAGRATSPLAGANHVPRSTRYCTATKAEMRCHRIRIDDWIRDKNADTRKRIWCQLARRKWLEICHRNDYAFAASLVPLQWLQSIQSEETSQLFAVSSTSVKSFP